MMILLELVAVVYGASFTLVAGGGVLWTVSPAFRRVLIGDRRSL